MQEDLTTKIQQFYASVAQGEFDLIALTETWILDEVVSGHIQSIYE